MCRELRRMMWSKSVKDHVLLQEGNNLWGEKDCNSICGLSINVLTLRAIWSWYISKEHLILLTINEWLQGPLDSLLLSPFLFNLLTSLWERTKEKWLKYERETENWERETKEWVNILKSEWWVEKEEKVDVICYQK